MALEILMPQFDPEGTPARVAAWLAQVGEAVAAGQSLVRVEHDKAVFEMPAQVAGRLLAVVVTPGQMAPPHTILGVLGQPGEDIGPLLARAERERAAAPPPRGVNGRLRRR